MGKRQFVAAKFRKDDRRSYTYHNDGDPVKPGDEVKVTDRAGTGWQRVYVDSVSFDQPTFATKPILGLAPPVEPVAPAPPPVGTQSELSLPAAARGDPFDHREVPHTFMFEE